MLTTRHVLTLADKLRFAQAPPAAQRSVLLTQATAIARGTANLREALDCIEFLGAEHPAVLSIRAALDLMLTEADALDALRSTLT